MKWIKTIGTILSIGALTQLIKWLLDSLEIRKEFGNPLTILISIIFTTLTIVIIVLNHTQTELKKIRKYLKNNNNIKRMIKTNKKGMIEARILLIPLALVLLYLIWVAFFT